MERVSVVLTSANSLRMRLGTGAGSISLIAQWNPRSYREDVGVTSRLVMVVEPYRAVRAEIVSISCLGREAALDSIHSTSCDHLPLSTNDQIDLFCGFVMMRKICSSWSKVHPEKARHHVCVIDRITPSVSWANQQLVQNRLGMALHSFLFHVIQSDNSGLLRRSAGRELGRDFEAHHQDPQRLAGIIGKPMLYARGKVGEIIRAQGIRAVTVLQSACTLQNKVDFFLAIVENALAGPVGVNRNFAEARNASQNSTVCVTCAENRFVVAGCRR